MSFDTWYYIAIYETLCVIFSSKLKATNVFPEPEHMLKSKARDNSSKEKTVLSRDSKELFVQRFV